MNYSKTAVVSIFALLLCASSVLSLSICNATGLPSEFSLESARPYNDLNQSMTFYAHFDDANHIPLTGNNTLVNVSFQNGTYNMTYDSVTGRWAITVISAVQDDVTFVVMAQNDFFQCRTLSFTSKWRTPYYIDFMLYKQQLNTTDPGHYLNDFQYVVLLDENAKNNDDLFMRSWDTGANRGMDWVLESLGSAKVNHHVKPDTNIYFWGKYSNGAARIKVYEPSNYSVYVMNNKVQLPINTIDEFDRPTTEDVEFMGKIYGGLKLYNVSNVSNTAAGYNLSVVKISFTKWEANSYYVAMNLFIVILVACVYFGLMWMVFYVTKDSQSGGQILVWYLLIATPIAMGFIFYIN